MALLHLRTLEPATEESTTGTAGEDSIPYQFKVEDARFSIVKVWEVEGCESATESNIADCSKGVGTGCLSYNQELRVCDCSD